MTQIDDCSHASASSVSVKSTEVSISPKTKRYTLAFKLRLIEEADRCQGSGQVASLLRREGLYFSTLADFRKQKARGLLDAKPAAPARNAHQDTVSQGEYAAVQRQVRRLQKELTRAQAIIDLQKKVSELLGLALEPIE